MIFSHDKKPTEPGWWWVLSGDKVPMPILVVEKLGIMKASDAAGEYVISNYPRWLWGDRIEPPTIETKETP